MNIKHSIYKERVIYKKIILQSVLMAGIVGNFSAHAVKLEDIAKLRARRENQTTPQAGSSTTIYDTIAKLTQSLENNMNLQSEIVNYKSEIAELKKAKADNEKNLTESLAKIEKISGDLGAKETELKATKAELATAEAAQQRAEAALTPSQYKVRAGVTSIQLQVVVL